jgi:hypothetical protein
MKASLRNDGCAMLYSYASRFSFYFRFCTPAGTTVFFVMEYIFHSGLDGTMILYILPFFLSRKLKLGELLGESFLATRKFPTRAISA